MAKSSTLIKEADIHCKGLTLCKDGLDENLIDLDFQRIKKESFKNCPNISIDKAIMEKTKKGMVIPLWLDGVILVVGKLCGKFQKKILMEMSCMEILSMNRQMIVL